MGKLRLWLRRRCRRLMFLALRALARAVGFSRARALGKLLGELEFRLHWRTRRCMRDMALALGQHVGDPRVKAQLRRAHHASAAAVLEILAMFARRQDDGALASHCELEGLEHLRPALAAGRGAILLGTHMGNGALLAARLASCGWPVSLVYREARMMSAGFFDRGLSLYGVEGILANEGLRAYGRMLRALRQGRIVFVTLDQGVKRVQDGIVMRFLGKDIPMPAGPAQLARHSRAPVLPVVTAGAEPVWRFQIGAPLARAGAASLRSEMERLVRATELQVLRHPDLWSWHQRRWRKYPPAPALQGQGARLAPDRRSSRRHHAAGDA